jgi:hypothetical protein
VLNTALSCVHSTFSFHIQLNSHLAKLLQSGDRWGALHWSAHWSHEVCKGTWPHRSNVYIARSVSSHKHSIHTAGVWHHRSMAASCSCLTCSISLVKSPLSASSKVRSLTRCTMQLNSSEDSTCVAVCLLPPEPLQARYSFRGCAPFVANRWALL